MESYFKITKLDDNTLKVNIENLSIDEIQKIGIKMGVNNAEILNGKKENKNIIESYRFFTNFAISYLLTTLKYAPKNYKKLLLNSLYGKFATNPKYDN